MTEPLRILLIDDDEHSFVLTQELLLEINHRPVALEWVGEFDAGLELLLKAEHEVYLLDYRLGLRDGIDLLRQARAQGCRAPVLILTGQVDPDIDQRALEAGATDYLVKDVYDVSRLEHAIRYAVERQSLMAELELERNLLRSLMDSLPDNIYFKDRESRFIRVSRAMANWFRLEHPEDAVGRTDRDFFAAEHADQAREDEIRLMLSDRPVIGKEERETRHDGSTNWVSTSKLPLRDVLGNVVGTFGVSRDITAQKEALLALRSSERANRMIVDTAFDAFIAMDSTGLIIDWNPQAERTFGWSRLEVLGEPLADVIIPPPMRQAHWDGLRTYLKTRVGNLVGRRLEVTAQHRQGHEFPIELTIAPIPQESGVFFAAFARDISDRKQAENELRKSKDAAEAANRAKSDFLANISHEIRTPMNAVLGMTELVLDSELTTSQRDYLQMVRGSGESLLLLLNEILDFSKIESGLLELDLAVFGLRDLLGDTLQSLSVRANREHLELANHIHLDVPDTLLGDAARLRQIVVNLVGNAIKFTHCGEIVVRVFVDRILDQRVRLHFAVSDTGIGIAPEKQDLIFKAFQQADSSTTRKYGGTGLGLTICSRLVGCMQGNIWVESELGTGSVFHFTAEFEIAESPLPSGAEGRLVQGTRVLIVDDNATNRLILREMVTNWGMQPTTAASVSEGMQQLETAESRGEPFTLILSDVQMPGEDGFSFVERVKADDRFAMAVVMLLTSGDRPDDLQRCAKLGVAAYLRKPIKQSELFDSVVSALNVTHSEHPATVPSAAIGRSETTITLPPLSILLAEDSVVNQKLALGLLSRDGHRVTVANNGLEAVMHVEAGHFDVVLMDVQMPHMDGHEATRLIRAKERARQSEQSGLPDVRRLPIIAMTAHAMLGDREKCLAAGMDSYLTKPVRSQLLFEAIRRVVLNGESDALDGIDATETAVAEMPSSVVHGDGQACPSYATFAVSWPEALKVVQGDRSLLVEIAVAYLEESTVVLTGLHSALQTGDARSAERWAHTIKSSFRTFGAEKAHDLARVVEKFARDGKLTDVAERLAELEAAVVDVGVQLRRVVETGDVPK